MKVGTDAVLLGSWADVTGKKRGLDIGTGTGILAMMLAQKGLEHTLAIEIDEQSSLVAKKNVIESKFAEQISVENVSLQELYRNRNEKFDLIISNPPFFKDSIKPVEYKKTIAKHQEALTLEDLITGVEILLKDSGVFYCVLPYSYFANLEKISKLKHIFLNRILLIYPNESSIKPNRCLLLFEKKMKERVSVTLTIETNKRHHFTKEYIELTKNFYIKF